MFKLLMVLSILIGLTACDGNGTKKDENMTKNEQMFKLMIMVESLEEKK